MPVPPPLRPVALASALLPLAGCLGAVPFADPPSAALARTLAAESRSFHAALALAAAPECEYRDSQPEYDRLTDLAQTLRTSVATAASPARRRAADALSRTVESARASHALASARRDDPHGPCMAPAAIALNAAAIDRAAAAFAGGDR